MKLSRDRDVYFWAYNAKMLQVSTNYFKDFIGRNYNFSLKL
jgi:hypothetical protein